MKTSIKIFLLLIPVLLSCSKEKSTNKISVDKKREFANALFNRRLYRQAIEEYKELLQYYNLDKNLEANINYMIGDIYFERLNDYEQALSYYMKVKHLYPESRLVNDSNKKIIQCLERLDRAVDAQQALKEATNLNPDESEDYPGDVIAEIGDRKITSGYLDHLIQQNMESMPENLKPKKINKQQKLSFLREYIIVELLYNSAKRRGLDKDKDIIEGAFQAKKFLMANKVKEQEFKDKINITEKDLKNYYENHKEEFAEKDDQGNIKEQKTFGEVKEQVYQRVLAEKQTEIMDDLVSRLMDAQEVKIYTDKVK